MVKKLLNALTVSALGLSLFFTSGVNAASNPLPVEDYTTIEEVQELEIELVNTLRALPADASIDTEIDNFLITHPVKPMPKTEYPGPDPMPGVDPKEYTNPNEPFDVPAYIDEEIEQGAFRAYTINNNTDLIFTDDYTFFVQNTVEGVEQTSPTPEGFVSVAAASKKKHASTSYTAKSWVGLKLWSGYTSGWFNYNGSKVTAEHDSSYIKRASVSIWQVDNYRKGKTDISTKLAEVYCRANVSWGYKIGDVGITIQDKYVKLYVRSNEKGEITRHRTIN